MVMEILLVATQNVIVKDVTAPVAPTLADVTGECEASVTAPTAQDNCAGTITASTNGSFVLYPQGTHVVTWTFDDGNGNTSVATSKCNRERCHCTCTTYSC